MIWPRSNGAPAAVRPHIFVFVVDSLRRDYVSPYNRQVTFTPALERFAAESTVFERAFTRYGATGLSVPSLWVGGLVLHKQYVTPFAPMNTLARLLEHEQYAQWISMDNILDVILPPSARRVAARCRRSGCRLPSVPHASRDPRPARSAEDRAGRRRSCIRSRRTSTSPTITREGSDARRRRIVRGVLRALRVPRPPAGHVLRRVHRRSEVTRRCSIRASSSSPPITATRSASRGGWGTRTRSFPRSCRCR